MEINVNYLKVVTLASGPLTATGTVIKAGSRVGFTEGVLTDSSGAIAATASSALLILQSPRRWAYKYSGIRKDPQPAHVREQLGNV